MKGSLINAWLGASLVLGLSALGSAEASKIYKSVDERGNIQFTQTPPATGEYEIIEAGVSFGTSSAANNREPAEAEAAEEEARDNEAVEELLVVNREEAERVCNQAREELAAMQDESQQVVRRGKDGALEPLSAEERAERIEELNAIIEQACFD
ncbi:MAG TPA: DUF4124 domain-containing protein [Halothiobacillus sp.]|nr:DUF4124 domain-containing protein [Halothiobacillus sp.]